MSSAENMRLGPRSLENYKGSTAKYECRGTLDQVMENSHSLEGDDLQGQVDCFCGGQSDYGFLGLMVSVSESAAECAP